MLEEVELLVAGRGPEVGALDHQALPLGLSLRVDEGEAGLPSEGGIGQHHVEVDARVTAQAVVHGDVRLVPADAVKVQVHDAEPRGTVDDLPAVQGTVLEVGTLVRIHVLVVVNDIVVGREQKPAGAAGGVAYGRVGPRAHDVDYGLDQGARREVLSRTRLDVLGVALQQRLIGVALHVGAQGQPVLAVDQVLDEPGQHGRLLYPVLGLAENDAECAGLPG